MHDLLDQGLSLRAAARQSGLAINTVRRYARADTRIILTLDPYKP
ncbi:hypothetical protein ACIRRI_34525 [Streptomyces mirabilis]